MVVSSVEAGQRAALSQAAQALGLVLQPEQLDALLAYVALIAKWTKVYNLTAVRAPAEMLSLHIVDSLAAIPPLRRHLAQAGLENGARLLDVGSGAGLPGVVMAICCPQLQVTCVDTVAKKAAFITQAALALRLPNLHGLHARVESIEQPFDVVCSRAFASLPDFTRWSTPALSPQGVWLAMKGRVPNDEVLLLAEQSPDVDVFHVEPLHVPNLDAERCIVWMRPKPASQPLSPDS